MQYYKKVVMNRYHAPDKDSVARPKISRSKLLPIDFMPETSTPIRCSQPCLEPTPPDPYHQYIPPTTNKPLSRKASDKSKRSKRYMNPLVDARRNIKMMEQFNIKISQDLEKLKKPKHATLVKSSIEISSLLVLASERYNAGMLKKVLCVPEFQVYFLEEQPIDKAYDMQLLEENRKRWERAVQGSYRLEVRGYVWNDSEGFISLIYDFAESYTISELLYEFGAMPENVLQQLTTELVSGLINLEHQGLTNYWQLKPQQVKFSAKTGKIQLHPSIQLLSKPQQTETDEIINRLLSLQPIIKKPLPQKQTSFRLGYLLLVCSLGQFPYDQQVRQSIRILLNQYPRLTKHTKKQAVVSDQSSCCLIHMLDTISGLNSPNLRPDMEMYRIRRAKWSDEFVDLLCGCLRFSEMDRLTLEEIKIHHFLVQKDLANRKVDIRDFLKALELKLPTEFINTIVGNNKLDYFCRQIEKMLPNSRAVPHNTNENNDSNEVLSQLTGKPIAVVAKALQRVYSKF